jgi:hypothetical protein
MPRNGFAALVEEASVSVSYAPIVCRDKQALQEGTGQSIEIRQSKYLNNFVEQSHRAIKRIIRSMLGFKAFRPAGITLQGIKLMHRVKKGQQVSDYGQSICHRTILFISGLKHREDNRTVVKEKINAAEPSLLSWSALIVYIVLGIVLTTFTVTRAACATEVPGNPMIHSVYMPGVTVDATPMVSVKKKDPLGGREPMS